MRGDYVAMTGGARAAVCPCRSQRGDPSLDSKPDASRLLVSRPIQDRQTIFVLCTCFRGVESHSDFLADMLCSRNCRAESDSNSGSLNSAIPACSDTHLGEGGKSTNSRIGHRVCLQLFLASVSLAVGAVSCGATNGQPCHCWSSISDLDLGQSAPETYEHFPSPVNSTELRC